jgi:hypothetical protein
MRGFLRSAAVGAFHEISGDGNGAIDGAAATLFAAGIAARKLGKGATPPATSVIDVISHA